MIYTYTVPCFDLQQIHQSGQCFRMVPLPGGAYAADFADRRPAVSPADPPIDGAYAADFVNGYRVICGSRLLRAWQDREHIYFDCPGEDLPFWESYFDMDTDYEAVIASIDKDNRYLRDAASCGRGIRILRQEPWEMIITFVISQQKTIPAIRQLVEALSRRYGSPLEDTYSFPTPGQLSAATLDDLLALKLGYRAKYIHRLCRDAVSGALDPDILKSLDYGDAMNYLTGFYGIGKKVANCVCLFGLHHVEAFPVDTWIERILMEQYYNSKKYRHTPRNRLLDRMVEDVFGQYGGCAGIMQQYIFHYERNILHGNH